MSTNPNFDSIVNEALEHIDATSAVTIRMPYLVIGAIREMEETRCFAVNRQILTLLTQGDSTQVAISSTEEIYDVDPVYQFGAEFLPEVIGTWGKPSYGSGSDTDTDFKVIDWAPTDFSELTRLYTKENTASGYQERTGKPRFIGITSDSSSRVWADVTKQADGRFNAKLQDFWCFPASDSLSGLYASSGDWKVGQYILRIPAWTRTPPEYTTYATPSTWWSTTARNFLTWRAASTGAFYNRDYEAGAVLGAQADGEKRRLMRGEKLNSFKSDTLSFTRGVNEGALRAR